MGVFLQIVTIIIVVVAVTPVARCAVAIVIVARRTDAIIVLESIQRHPILVYSQVIRDISEHTLHIGCGFKNIETTM